MDLLNEIYGKTLLGKVDQVPGLFYVATQCEHLAWFPLAPGQSYIVKEGAPASEELPGIPIPRDARSILMVYSRAVLAVIILMTLLVFLIQREYGLLLVVLVSAALLGGSYWLTRCQPTRALELATIAGIPLEEVARRFVPEQEIADFIAKNQKATAKPNPPASPEE